MRQAGFSTELEVTQYILEGFATLNPGVVYEFNQDAHWELDAQNTVYKEMFTACAVTLGTKLEDWVEKAHQTAPARYIVAGTVAFEFLKNAISFVTDLIAEQAQKEEYETLPPQFIYLPPFGVTAPPKPLREAVRLEQALSAKILPVVLEKLNAQKVDITPGPQMPAPFYTAVFLVPWQKARKKGKK